MILNFAALHILRVPLRIHYRVLDLSPILPRPLAVDAAVDVDTNSTIEDFTVGDTVEFFDFSCLRWRKGCVDYVARRLSTITIRIGREYISGIKPKHANVVY